MLYYRPVLHINSINIISNTKFVGTKSVKYGSSFYESCQSFLFSLFLINQYRLLGAGIAQSVLQAGRSMSRSSIPGRGKLFLYSMSFRPFLPPIQWVPGAFPQG
jgi:hypothetical protein